MLDELLYNIQKSDDWVRAWKDFIEKVRPVHHFGCVTFKTAPKADTALQNFRKFLLRNVCRPERQHLFLWYVWDTQPHRAISGDNVYHIHFVLCFEGQPMDPKVIEEMWNKKRGIGSAKIDWYDSNRRGITYNYSKHVNFNMEALCHNRIEQHKKHGCPFRKDSHLWIEKM